MRGNPRFIELFAGIGLVRLALERAGWRCVYANDIDHKKRDVYIANFPGDHFDLSDIWSVDPLRLPHPVELITASFPCIDLSLAGNRSGLVGKHSSTFWALIRILNALRVSNLQPQAVMVENVVGFLSSRGGEDFAAAIGALNDCGYVVDSIVLDARYFTAQSRPRLFLLGIVEDLAKKHTIQPNESGILSPWNIILDSSSSVLRPSKLRSFVKKHQHLHWGFLDIPEPPALHNNFMDIVENLPEESDRWWGEEQVAKLLLQMPPVHLSRLKAGFKGKRPLFGTVYRRKRSGGTRAELRTDGLAGCLRTPRGGSSKQIVVRAWKGQIRARWMTPREYGRLQGVPDSFVLPANDQDAYFGFGDAVCVPAVQWLTEVAINPILRRSKSKSKTKR